MVTQVGRARRARRHAQTGVGGLSETALPSPLESPLTKGDTGKATTGTNSFTPSGSGGRQTCPSVTMAAVNYR